MPTRDPRCNKHGIIPKRKWKRYILHRFKIKVFNHKGEIVDNIVRSISAQKTGSCWLKGSKDQNGRRPLLVRYLYHWFIVKSQAGDLNNPDERNDSFLESLYIELPDPIHCQKCGAEWDEEDFTPGQYKICPECNEMRE
jgi:hypothetical protein